MDSDVVTVVKCTGTPLNPRNDQLYVQVKTVYIEVNTTRVRLPRNWCSKGNTKIETGIEKPDIGNPLLIASLRGDLEHDELS